jgi:LysR family transcriptional activator of nhaA
MLRFNYHHLYYFYMIAEEGSVTHAAKKLRLAQSSLSMQLGQFEAFLEKKLFLREGKKIFLTEDGIHVLSYAKAIFNLGDELADSLGDRARKGQLRIEIGVTNFVPKSFADTLLNFLYVQNEIPYIQLVEKNLTTMIKKLSVHKLDMILSDSAHKAPAEQGIQNHILAKIPVLLCGSKTLTSRVKRFPGRFIKSPHDSSDCAIANLSRSPRLFYNPQNKTPDHCRDSRFRTCAKTCFIRQRYCSD